jgi:hypothetical protein
MKKRIIRVLIGAAGLILFFPALVLSPITYILWGETYVEACVAMIVFENGLK